MTHHTDAERAEFDLMRFAFESKGSEAYKAWLIEVRYGDSYKPWDVVNDWRNWQTAWQAARRDPAVPVPQFSRIAQKKLDYLLEAGEAITGYAIENKDGRRGAIDCHGFVYWWQDAAAPQPPEAAPVQLPEPEAKVHAKVGTTCMFSSTIMRKGDNIYTEQQVRELLAAAKVERKPLTDEQVFECTTGTLSEQGHHLIHASDPDYAAMCGTEPGARWILSNVYPENSLAFARAIERAHGIQEQST